MLALPIHICWLECELPARQDGHKSVRSEEGLEFLNHSSRQLPAIRFLEQAMSCAFNRNQFHRR